MSPRRLPRAAFRAFAIRGFATSRLILGLMLIRLTPHTPTYSMRRDAKARLSQNAAGYSNAIRKRCGLPPIPGRVPMAGWLSLPSLRSPGCPRSADTSSVALQGLRLRHVRYRGNRLAPNPYAFDALVLRCLLGGNSHTGPVCPAAPTTVGHPVRNCLGDAPEAPAGDGAPGSRAAS